MNPEVVKCSFCGLLRQEVTTMVCGSNVAICNECVDLCKDICDDSIKCIDCELPIDKEIVEHWKDPNTLDHKNLCCDCFDEKLGMPEESRNTPRPTKK